jgi:hypothetical protein
MYSPRDLVKEYLKFWYPIKLQGYKTPGRISLSTLSNYKVTKLRLQPGQTAKENNEATLMGGFFIAQFVYPIKNIIYFSYILIV